ncbi:Wzz/FepE/Etk N-terminal domain-containing protein [Ignavibacteria bacterium 4148-Me]|uniref:GumC family protein n=1 Tax=Rosettibacter primus TaxID=3111523 RepID=UPI00336C1A01
MEKLNSQELEQKSFIDFLIVLVKWRKLIILNVVIITLSAVIISLIMPKWYTSTANILPPKNTGGLLGSISGFSSTIKDLSKTLGRLGTTSEEAYNYLAILQSRTSFEKVINKFNLREVYKFDPDDPIEEIIDELESNVKFNVEDEGNITIKVTDKDPKRAAAMANYFVQILNEISIELGTLEAKNNREFIEKRYLQVLKDLKNVEDSLKYFSEKFSVYSIEDQTKAAIKAAADIKAQIELQKIEYELLSRNYGNDHPLVLEKKLMINELQNRLKTMKFGESNLTSSSLSLYTPFSQLPEVGIEYLRLMREYELQGKLLEFILPVYEQAKIEEKKDIPVCVVLDEAVPAQKKSYPKRVIIVVASFVGSLFLSIILALFLEKLSNLSHDTEKYKKITEGIFIPLKSFFKRGQ